MSVQITKKELESFDRIKRLNLVNSITGIKPANLVGSISPEGNTNLAVFSSVVHLGSHPALIGMIIRPAGEVKRHTYENIIATGVYTINHVHTHFTTKAHYTSAKFPVEVSEFSACGFTEEYLPGFAAPFVAESTVKFGLKFKKEMPIDLNNTILIIGEVENIILPGEAQMQEGQLNLEHLHSVGISGLNTYYELQKIANYPYEKPEDASRHLHEKQAH